MAVSRDNVGCEASPRGLPSSCFSGPVLLLSETASLSAASLRSASASYRE
jgi:hypothetical protein